MNGHMHEKMDEAKEQRERERLDAATLAKAVLADLEWLSQQGHIDRLEDQQAVESALGNQRELVRRIRGA